MNNLKAVGMGGKMHINTGPLNVALKAKIPMPSEVFNIVKQVEAEMLGKLLDAKSAYTFMDEVRNRIADLIVIEIDDAGDLKSAGVDGHVSRNAEKELYEVTINLKSGTKFLGYSDRKEPSRLGRFYLFASDKELQGRIVVAADEVISFLFKPIQC